MRPTEPLQSMQICLESDSDILQGASKYAPISSLPYKLNIDRLLHAKVWQPVFMVRLR